MTNIRLPNINVVHITGRLTQDPELLYTQQKGTPICKFSIASDRNYKDKESGEWKKVTLFIRVVAWGNLAERMGDILKKGSPVYVFGSLQLNTWKNADGKDMSRIEIRANSIQSLEVQSPVEKEQPIQDEIASEEDELPF
jgi:single-strand DNA-binding protein